MRKHAFILVISIAVISLAFTAFAKHEGVIPYESILRHMPWADAGDIRYHITIHKPYEKWDKWPGKGEMYKGKEPHGALLTTYVNSNAIDSIKKTRGMVDESMIVKENYDKDKNLITITVMYKVKGYNPEGGDWFWAKYDPKFNILEEGKVKSCLECHGKVKGNDYIFTGKVTGK